MNSGKPQARSFADVLPLMSQETQAFFEDASNGAGAVAALETGELVVDGKTTPFDPVADLLIDDLRDLRDDFAGQSEAETPRRKELYAIAGDGRARKLVFIFEADAWRFHSPFVKTPILSP